MGVINWMVQRAYDAINWNNRRRRIAVDNRSEDRLLLPLDRDQLITNARSLRRNHAIAAYAIRKHLDYVSSFNFQCRVDPVKWGQDTATALARRVEELVNWWARPFNCDVSQRFSLQGLIRLAEGLAVTDGDAFVYKLSDGRVQIIEGDRVRQPSQVGDFFASTFDASRFIHGVEFTDAGKITRYAICDRTGSINGFELREVARADFMLHHAYRDRYDQIRGVSPLSSAMNTFFDLYEAQEYALAKMKLAQLFALKFKHATANDADSEPYSFDFGAGPQVVELDPDDDAEFLESATPSNEFQAFMVHGIQTALKALDIPFSFYDESHTNYSGARQALLQYQQSIEAKRDNLRSNVLNPLTVWRLALFIADGELELPDGMTLDDLQFEWIGAPLPWIDPLKEVTANALAVKSGFKSRQTLCKEQGEDFFTVADQIAAENAYLKEKGLSTDIENITLGDAINATSNNERAA